MAVSNLDMHALFVLGDLRAKLVKQFQSRFVYITEQTPEGIYIAEIDTETALVVDDKPRLELKVGDHFRASVLPSREGGKFELRFRDIKLTVYGLGDYAFVSSNEGQGIVFKEGHSVIIAYSLALKVTSSPLRHLAALPVTAFRVLVNPSCNCSWAANTSITLWPSLNTIPWPSFDDTKA